MNRKSLLRYGLSVLGKELQTSLDYPPMQRRASFNLEAVTTEMARRKRQAKASLNNGFDCEPRDPLL